MREEYKKAAIEQQKKMDICLEKYNSKPKCDPLLRADWWPVELTWEEKRKQEEEDLKQWEEEQAKLLEEFRKNNPGIS